MATMPDLGRWHNRIGVIADADNRICSEGSAIRELINAPSQQRLAFVDRHSDGGSHCVRDYDVRYSALVRLMNNHIPLFRRDVSSLQHHVMMLSNEINQLQDIR